MFPFRKLSLSLGSPNLDGRPGTEATTCAQYIVLIKMCESTLCFHSASLALA